MREQERDTEEIQSLLPRRGGAPMAVGLSTVRLFPLKRVGRKEVPEARSVWEVLSLEVKNPEAVPQRADGGRGGERAGSRAIVKLKSSERRKE